MAMMYILMLCLITLLYYKKGEGIKLLRAFRRSETFWIKNLGYTLPELLITILLIGILFSIALVFTSGMRHTKKLRDYSIAISLAQQAIEVVKSSPFSSLAEEDAGVNSVEVDFNKNDGPTDLLMPEFSSGGIVYKRKVTISDVKSKVNDELTVGMKLVEVVVSWKNLSGEEVDPFIVTTTVADLN